ncbi:MAG: hypothetical protein QF615_08315 [Planctomycetota bacterium]|nr:hypothetical protein [Planctomycetota bacterium]
MLAVLKLDREATVGYLRENLPSYLEFEGWVLEQNGGTIDQEAAEAWNRSIQERIHHERARATIHATVGREDDGTLTSAVILNHIEDWHLAHADLVRSLK